MYINANVLLRPWLLHQELACYATAAAAKIEDRTIQGGGDTRKNESAREGWRKKSVVVADEPPKLQWRQGRFDPGFP